MDYGTNHNINYVFNFKRISRKITILALVRVRNISSLSYFCENGRSRYLHV